MGHGIARHRRRLARAALPQMNLGMDMDEADKAERQEEMARQAALIVRRRVGPTYTGSCLNCGAELERPFRWCDGDCREDWVKREDK